MSGVELWGIVDAGLSLSLGLCRHLCRVVKHNSAEWDRVEIFVELCRLEIFVA